MNALYNEDSFSSRSKIDIYQTTGIDSLDILLLTTDGKDSAIELYSLS